MRFGLLVLIVILVGGFIFWRDISSVVKGKSKNMQTAAKITEVRKGGDGSSPTIVVSQQWDLPAELKEVSGIAYLDKYRFTCVQDEEGSIYVYNHADQKIEKKIPFGSPGDFEDIALVGNTAWVLRADGTLFEVDMNNAKSAAKEYKTSLTIEHNVEGLTYDKAANRLLLAIKDEGPETTDHKGIYAFDLGKKQLVADPVWKIDLSNELFETGKESKKGKGIKPSAIAIHPTTGDIYITDGPKARLLIMDSQGSIKQLLKLGKGFEQPEGIAFGPQGELYISNEGNKQAGNILQVTIQ